jgi:hypothetical protein
MYLHTKKQRQYFDKVIKLHCDYGYGGKRIAGILPISNRTATKWIAIFAAEKEVRSARMAKSKGKKKYQGQLGTAEPREKDIRSLRTEIARLQAQLKHEKLRADAYDEMINVAESMFKIPIRKKAGAKR